MSGVVEPRQILDFLKLRGHERSIMEILVRSFGRNIPTERIVSKMYAEDVDGGPLYAERILYVNAYRLRKKLKPLGLTVKGLGGGRGSHGAFRLERIAA